MNPKYENRAYIDCRLCFFMPLTFPDIKIAPTGVRAI